MASADPALRVLLGDHPEALAVKSGTAGGPEARYQDGHPIGHFRRFVAELDADIAEIPLMTFLSARQAGVPLVLLPVVVLARFQHPFLIADTSRGPLAPADLAGRRVAIRAYSVTTAVWIRDILQQEHGVDPASVDWIAFEDPHVAAFRNPPNVTRAPAGATAEEMLRRGEVDAAVLRAVPPEGPLRPLIPDAQAAGRRWGARHGGVQINHLLCAPADRAARLAPRITAWLEALHRGSRAVPAGRRTFLFGRDQIGPSLALGIACAHRQGVVDTPPDAEALLAGFPFEPPGG